MDDQAKITEPAQNFDTANKKSSLHEEIHISVPLETEVVSEKIMESKISEENQSEMIFQSQIPTEHQSNLITNTNFLTGQNTSNDPNNFMDSGGMFNTNHLQKFNTNLFIDSNANRSFSLQVEEASEPSDDPPRQFEKNYKELLENYRKTLTPLQVDSPEPKTKNFLEPEPEGMHATNMNSFRDF